MTKSDLHIYGLTVIYISSKIEDVRPISLSSLIIDAGHHKFKLEEIKQAERDIFQLLEFKLLGESVYDLAFS